LVGAEAKIDLQIPLDIVVGLDRRLADLELVLDPEALAGEVGLFRNRDPA
jgi:hypothetical protein